MAMEKQQAKFKILMFPWLAHGHAAPYLQLSKKLAATEQFDIYICSSLIILDSIRATLAKQRSSDSIKLIELEVPSSPDLPPQLHTTKNAPPHLHPSFFTAVKESSSSFTHIMDSLKPDLLLYDLFQPWAPYIASSRGVPCVFFTPIGSAPFAFLHHVYTHGAASTFPFQYIIIPGIYEAIIEQRKKIEPCLKDAASYEFMFGNFSRSTDVVLVNGCRAIEGKYADHLSILCKKEVVCVAPLMKEDHRSCSVSCDEDDDEILKWLSGKDRSSTVYVSSGSECFLSEEQIAEIAKGLLLLRDDGVNFIWVLLRQIPQTAVAALPAGFLEAVGGRGLVVEWAPQKKILAHPSIGALVSHCGWNSMTEGIYFGVPIVAIPMQYEQPINARVAAEAGAGVEVERRGGGCYAGEDVARAIKKVVVEKKVIERAKTLSEKVRENEEGEVNEAVEQLLRICRKNVKQV